MSGGGDDDPLGAAARIEQLLAELRAQSGPLTWPRIEELVARLTGLYGAGLERLLQAVEETSGLDGSLRDRVCGDELVSSLLLLHGLHPEPLDARIARALERARARIAGAGTIATARDGARVTVRLDGAWRCGAPRAEVAAALERALLEGAPEIVEVSVEGADWAAATDALVQIDLARSRAAVGSAK
jgi:hypothetical protein